MMKLRNHHFVFLLMVLVSGFVGTLMVIYLLHELFGFNPTWGILQYCLAALNEHTFLHSAVYGGLNVIIAYCFGMVLFVGWKQFLLERKWNKYLLANRHDQLSKQCNRKYNYLGQEIVVIEYNSMLAITSGVIHPKIIISSALISDFSEREVSAILLHEHWHCRNYDPLRMLIIKIIKDSFPFIPILKRFSHYITVWIELEADSYAVQHMNSPVDLASALLKCSKMSRRMTVGVGFADDAINYRLLRLMEPKKVIRVPIMHFSPLAISLFTIFIISSIVISGCS